MVPAWSALSRNPDRPEATLPIRPLDQTAPRISTQKQSTIHPKNLFKQTAQCERAADGQRPATVDYDRLPQQHHPGGSLEFSAGEPHEVHPLGKGLPVPALAVPVVGL